MKWFKSSHENLYLMALEYVHDIAFLNLKKWHKNMFNMIPFTQNVIRHVFTLRKRIMSIFHKLIVVIFGQYINNYYFLYLFNVVSKFF